MVAFNNLHKLAIERWTKARNPDIDSQTLDLYALWDTSLSASENHRIIQDKLREYGLVSDAWRKQESYEWEQRAKEWYDEQLKKSEDEYQSQSFSMDDYVELDERIRAIGFYGPDVVYAIIRPKTGYSDALMFLGRVENDIALMQKILGGV